MNSVERVMMALKGRQPDRVPIIEFLVHHKVTSSLIPDAQDEADAMDRLDMDSVGCGAFFDHVRTHDDGTYVDEWGVLYRAGGPEMVDHPLRGPIVTMDDARTYQPPDPDDPRRLGRLPDLVRRYKGKRAITFHHRAAFMWTAYLMGIDNLLMRLLAEPEMAEYLMDKVLEANIQVARRAIHAGADVIALGDDYAFNKGPLMPPEVFEVMVLPRLRRMVEAIHEEGALCIKHSDGNIYPLLEMIVSVEPDGLNPIEPVAGMDLATVKRLVGDRVCLVGNIDCAHLLPHGTPAQVREAVRQAILDAAEGGGYIMSSSNCIHSSCDPDNVRAMIEACQEFGLYPLAIPSIPQGA